MGGGQAFGGPVIRSQSCGELVPWSMNLTDASPSPWVEQNARGRWY